MILIIGGAASGKRSYAKSLGYSEDCFIDATLGTGRVLYNLQDLLRDTNLEDGELLDALAAYDVIICTEIGCGVVPISAEDRLWRDRVGRMSTQLAKRADTVIKMVCGIPFCMKGELPCS